MWCKYRCNILLTSRPKTHVDYIREFAASDLGPKIAYAIMERERPPPPFCEARGCSQSPTWRCDSCDEGRYQCKACLSSSHASTPYHRVKWFNGEFYEDAWLRDAGVLLVLCPNSSGLPCKSSPSKPELPNGFWDAAPPSYAFSVSTSDIYSPAESEAFDSTSGAHPVDQPERHLGSDALDEGEVEGCPAFEDGFSRPSPQSSSPLGTGRARTCSSVELDPRGLHVVTICHENGIHGLGVQFCVCPGAPERDMQLVAKGIYPASRKNPTTGFTFRCLDRFFIDNLEGDTSAECFARKLQRLTAPDNPDSAPVGVLHLLRCTSITQHNRTGIRNSCGVVGSTGLSFNWRSTGSHTKIFGLGKHPVRVTCCTTASCVRTRTKTCALDGTSGKINGLISTHTTSTATSKASITRLAFLITISLYIREPGHSTIPKMLLGLWSGEGMTNNCHRARCAH